MQLGQKEASIHRKSYIAGYELFILCQWLMDHNIDTQIAELHLFQRLGKTILFNCETMLFYEVTPVVYQLVHLLRQDSPANESLQLFHKRFSKEEIKQAVHYLEEEKFIRDIPPPAPILIKRKGIRHLELMVTHDCNMRCDYCYGTQSDGAEDQAPYLYGSYSRGMSFETAKEGVDFIFDVSGPLKELSVIFFGGEPLLELGLLRKITHYIRKKESETGKTVRLSLSTNGMLLSQETVSFLKQNRISCQVSMDGDSKTHNRHRLLCDGRGSYDSVLPGIKRLLSARPGKVSVRATMSHVNLNLLETVKFLHNLGFGSVHIEPVIGNPDELCVTEDDVGSIKKQHEEIAKYLLECAEKDRYVNYTNLVKFIRHTTIVKDRQAHYCGAARTYIALAQDGSFYPCHRFVGLEEYRMGDLESGFDDRLQNSLLNLTVDDRPLCSKCWIRYLCGGGCWHNAVMINGSMAIPDMEVSCNIIRHLVECAMAVSSDLQELAKDKLSTMYETTSEPYLVAEQQQKRGR